MLVISAALRNGEQVAVLGLRDLVDNAGGWLVGRSGLLDAEDVNNVLQRTLWESKANVR